MSIVSGSMVAVNSHWAVTAAHVVAGICNLSGRAGENGRFRSPSRGYRGAVRLRAAQEELEAQRSAARIPINLGVKLCKRDAEMGRLFSGPKSDLALVELLGAPAEWDESAPLLKRPEQMRVGTALLKLGYPFSDVKASYHRDRGEFEIGAGLDASLFPLEGIATRLVDGGPSDNGDPIRIIESSSPDLMGQSGGPTVDKDGALWAIQSQRRWKVPICQVTTGFAPGERLELSTYGLTVHRSAN